MVSSLRTGLAVWAKAGDTLVLIATGETLSRLTDWLHVCRKWGYDAFLVAF